MNADGSSDYVDPLTSVEQKIKAIMAKIFQIDIADVNENTSTDNVDQWNSLEHVDLALNLQQEFDIEFTDSEIVEDLLSYKTAVQAVEAALKEKRT